MNLSLKKIHLVLLIALVPIVSYNLLASICLILFFFIGKYNRLVLLNLILFLFFGLLVFTSSPNITIFKYIISIIALLFLINNQKELNLTLFKQATIVLLIFAIFESTILRDLLRSFYRSSNIELHYDRYSCFFLFPGDLGAYCAIAISLHFLDLILNGLSETKSIHFIYIFINFFLLLLSQSRMAFFHIFISFAIILIIRPKYLFSLILLIPISFLFHEKLSYLFREDFLYLFQTFFSIEESSNNKRAQEFFEILNSTESDLGYYEGSLPSFLSRFGLFFSIILFVFILWTFSKFWKKINNKLASLIVILPIIITSLISAPLERPKLLLFSFAGILLAAKLSNKSINSFKINNNEIL